MKQLFNKFGFFTFLKGVCFILLVINSYILHAEGTRQVQPTAASHGRVQIMPYFTNFAMFDAAEEQRLHINICEMGEVIHMGFGKVRDFWGNIHNDVIFRIKDPLDSIVFGPFSLPDTGDLGFIDAYLKAVSGPIILNAQGYNSLTYTPHMTGNYYIEFSFTEPYWFERKIFEFFDVTVLSSTNQERLGRLWSKEWQITTNPQADSLNVFGPGFDGVLYIYSDDGVITQIDLNSMQPFVFNISANQSGCFNTGNYIQDRKSTIGNHTYPQYKIFLNNPDTVCFPSGLMGDFIAPTTITGCQDSFCINITVDKPGNVEVLLNFNGIPGYQANTEDVALAFEAVVGLNCIPWNGLNGLGQTIPAGFIVPIEVNYFNGLTHLPLYDVEANPNGFKATIIRPYSSNPIPEMFWDDSDIPGGIAQLTGCTDPNGCHSWQLDSCTSTYPIAFCSLGDMRTINTWWYARAISDTAYVPLAYPVVNANQTTPIGQNDTTVCFQSIQLNGWVNYAPYGIWSGGTGQFIPSDTSLNAVYIFHPTEISNGFVQLVLTSVGSPCTQASDTLNIQIHQPQLVIGTDTTICLGQSANLIAQGGLTYTWSPTGSLNNPHAPNPLATPIDNTTYTVNITDSNGCTDSAQQIVNILPLPPVNAGADQHICFGNGATFYVSGGGSYIWSTGSTADSIFVNPLNTTTYSVTATDANSCSAIDSVILFVNPLPIPNAGNNTHTCFGQSITLNGSGGIYYNWAPSASLNNSSLSSPIASPTVSTMYQLTVTDVNGCSATDEVYVAVYEMPTVSFTANPINGCQPLWVYFNDNSFPAIATWSWNFGDFSSTQNTSTLQHPMHIYKNPGVYDVSLTVTTADGCNNSLTIPQMITVYPNPIAHFDMTPRESNLDMPTIHFYDQSMGAVGWHWNFGNPNSGILNTSELPNPSHTYSTEGYFSVLLIVESIHGCMDSIYSEVYIKPDFSFYIPNVFTPNGDGLNDHFQGYGTNISEYHMYIFSRWGKLIYETDSYNKPWNGMDLNNDPLMQDVYVYKIIIKDNAGTTHRYYGGVTLLR